FQAMLSVLCLSLSSLAAQAEPVSLFPWRAEYQAAYKSGIPINGSAVRELKRQADGTWLYNFDVGSFFLKIDERTTLRWEDATVVPLSYKYRRSGWVKTREA